MGSWKNAHTSALRARDALQGPHQVAHHAPGRITDFAIGDLVRVVKTGVTARVTGKTSWGDHYLEGLPNFYSGSQLEKA